MSNVLAPRIPAKPFSLQRMEAIYDQAQGAVDQPHRHDYFTVVLVEAARGMHHIDFMDYALGERQVFFISPGQVHQLVATERPQGWVITFSADFLADNAIPQTFIYNLNLFRFFGESPPLHSDATTWARLDRTARDMEACLPQELVYRNRALGALLQLLLIYCNNSCTLDSRQLDEQDAQVCLLRDFKQRVEKQFREWHKVSAYASDISISPKHLSETVRNLTGKTAKAHIQDRLVLEAKRLLRHTEKTAKEIAYELGFTEPLHFSSFFKKQTGQSPTAFRTS